MSEAIKFDRNYLKLLIDNKDKLIEVPINDVKLILTYCEILLDRQGKAIEYMQEAIHSDSFTTLPSGKIVDISDCIVAFEDLLEILGDKENENKN